MESEKDYTFISLFSGGLTSFESTFHLISNNQKSIRIWFFDTKAEDPDTYRFIKESEEFLGKEIEIFSDGRNPWEVFKDERFIGNSRITPCNRVLKRQLLEKEISKQYPQKNVVLVFGISKGEEKRAELIINKWASKKIKTEFPLLNNGYEQITNFNDFERIYGFKVPQLYLYGFTHNNCGGACVKAGISQWVKLYKFFPESFLWHEEQEIETRKLLKKNVSILRDRHGNVTKPFTLRELRTKIEKGGFG